jgi:hypothetical protein
LGVWLQTHRNLERAERRDAGACRRWVASTPRPDPKRSRIDGVISVIWPNIILFLVVLIMAAAIVAGIVAVSRAVRRHS